MAHSQNITNHNFPPSMTDPSKSSLVVGINNVQKDAWMAKIMVELLDQTREEDDYFLCLIITSSDIVPTIQWIDRLFLQERNQSNNASIRPYKYHVPGTDNIPTICIGRAIYNVTSGDWIVPAQLPHPPLVKLILVDAPTPAQFKTCAAMLRTNPVFKLKVHLPTVTAAQRDFVTELVNATKINFYTHVQAIEFNQEQLHQKLEDCNVGDNIMIVGRGMHKMLIFAMKYYQKSYKPIPGDGHLFACENSKKVLLITFDAVKNIDLSSANKWIAFDQGGNDFFLYDDGSETNYASS